MSEHVAVVIPARYASSRFPGKPLAILAGKPMICHVCEKAAASSADTVLVATDDARIFDTVTAAEIANHAASVVVAKVGTAPIMYNELVKVCEQEDI